MSRQLQTVHEYWEKMYYNIIFFNGLLTNAFSEGPSGMLHSLNWLLLIFWDNSPERILRMLDP